MPSETRARTARHFFSRRGILSEWHPNYEYRPGQMQMAEAVEAALAENRHLIVEAGTGTGKTLAYLIPAILTGRRIVVSTGTKALQEQLFFKDIPFLQQHFEEPLSVCYMKGRNNYACRQKIYDAEREPILSGLEEVTDFQIIREWEKTTEIGDRAEIPALPANSTAWGKIDARREACTGRKCQQFERCFITEMTRRAHESNIIIVNHHLFFADLSIRTEEPEAGIIPEYAAVIFDEAHEIESAASDHFGSEVSNYQFQELRRDVLALSRRKNFGSEELDRVLTTLDETAQQMFALFPERDGRMAATAVESVLRQNSRIVADVLTCLDLLGAHLELIHDRPEELIPLANRVGEIGSSLRFWMEGNEPEYVYWLERRGRGVFLEATPVNVADLLRGHLFGRIPCVILASATLAVQGAFGFVQSRLGLDEPRNLIVPSHFDYPSQAILYVPQHLPDPRSPEFTKSAAEEIVKLLEISQGRAFVLCTSYQQMRQFHDLISFELEYPMLLQGTGPNKALIEEFKSTPNCVLFATSSFWQGVDVPGEQLSCVIIDKLPFAVPSDPIVEARSRAVRESGGNPFYDYQIPEAAISLKQGLGRLIRSRADRGVLAILDNRITRQRYGQIFFDSLPDYSFALNRDQVEKFFYV